MRVATNMLPSKPSDLIASIISPNSAHQARTPSYLYMRGRRARKARSKSAFCSTCTEQGSLMTHLTVLLESRVENAWCTLESKVKHLVLLNDSRCRDIIVCSRWWRRLRYHSLSDNVTMRWMNDAHLSPRWRVREPLIVAVVDFAAKIDSLALLSVKVCRHFGSVSRNVR